MIRPAIPGWRVSCDYSPCDDDPLEVPDASTSAAAWHVAEAAGWRARDTARNANVTTGGGVVDLCPFHAARQGRGW